MVPDNEAAILQKFYDGDLLSRSPEHQGLVFAEVQREIENSVVEWTESETFLKGVADVTILISPHYNTGKSRNSVKMFIRYIESKCNSSNSTLNFQAIFSEACFNTIDFESNVISKAASKYLLGLLNWALLTRRSDWCPIFVELLSNLAVRIRGRRFEVLVAKKLASFCSRMTPKTIHTFWEFASTDEKHLVLLSYLYRSCKYRQFEGSTSGKTAITENDYKETVLKAKGIIMQKFLTSKGNVDVWSLEKVSAELGQYLIFPDKDSINQEFILPLQKAILRSPERAISGACYLLESIGTDLTDYGLIIAKMLTPHLHSQSETTRQDSVKASVSLVKRMKSINSIKEVLEWYVSVFNGAEGKLTVAAHKMCILKVLKEIRMCAIKVNIKEGESNNLTTVSEWLIDQLTKIIETEVHEGTLVECFHVIYHWCDGLSKVNISNAISEYIPKGFRTNKGMTRAAFSTALGSYFKDRVNLLDPFLPLITSALVKLTANLNGTTLSEAIPLASIVAKSGDINQLIPHDALIYVRNVFDYINQNNISLLSSETKLEIIRIAKTLLIKDKGNINDNTFKTIALVMASDNFEIPKAITELVVPALLPVFPNVILELRKANDANIVSNKSCEKILIEISKTPMNHSWMPLASLRIAHQCSDSNLWVHLINKLHNLHGAKNKDMSTVCSEMWEDVQPYIFNFDNSLTSQRIVGTFSVYCCEAVVKCCVEKLQRLKANGNLLKVTKDEYFTFRTPEGQLFDTSVLKIDESESKNIKRESKVYSYKEQLEEIQLRKEIEEQRKAAGKTVTLSLKQKAAMEAQITKEGAIRRSMHEMDRQVLQCIGLFEVVIEANVEGIGRYVKDFINELVGLMQSYIAAPHANRLFQKLASSFFTTKNGFDGFLTHVSLSLISPKCEVGVEHDPKILKKSLQNILERLKIKSAEDDKFSNACYSLCFPLLNLAVQKYPEESSIVEAVIQITLNQVKRGMTMTTTTMTSGDNSSEFLPRILVNRLLYHVMGNCENCNLELAHSAVTSLANAVVLNHPANKNVVCIDSSEYVGHLAALDSDLKLVRKTGLQALMILLNKASKPTGEIFHNIRVKFFRMKYDSDSNLSKMAHDYAETFSWQADVQFFDSLIDSLIHPVEEIRVSSSMAIGEIVKMYPKKGADFTEKLFIIYRSHLIKGPSIVDDFGRVIDEGPDYWAARSGAALALKAISHHVEIHTAKKILIWIVTRAFLDKIQIVHNAFLETAIEIVKMHGKVCFKDFEAIFETYIQGSGAFPDYDNLRLACVVLMGCLARHLDSSDGRVKSIFGRLMDILPTSSEKVQEEITKCLPLLVPSISNEQFPIMESLFNKLMDADIYAERRGAAYGIAGMVKGLGLNSIKEHYIMDRIVAGMLDTTNFKHREGALMLMELLGRFHGRLLEPYVVHNLTFFLQCIGDKDRHVVDAAKTTAKCILTQLSGHGITRVLPTLLTVVDEESWKIKCVTLDLLGRLPFGCASEKTSEYFPIIVSKLIEALGDSHNKVQDAAAEALKIIGSNIQNPEIRPLVPVILQALQNQGNISKCLQTLITKRFDICLDEPSVAFIMPVIERGFQDRSIENRKMAGKILENIHSRILYANLAPYIDNALPGLKRSLLDPTPEVRAVAAKILGTLSKAMGEKCYNDLLPWLLQVLTSKEVNLQERSGAAQGLTEVFGSLSENKLHQFMTEIIKKPDSVDIATHIRGGYMMMFIYMPSVSENLFSPYLGDIINVILRGLQDECEFISETALKAGRSILNGYTETAVLEMLPKLESALFDDNWRVQWSSLKLMEDLMHKLSGVYEMAKGAFDIDDDNFETQESRKKISDALGQGRRNCIAAAVFIKTFDRTSKVQQIAERIWKVIVGNSSENLRQIIPTLISVLVCREARNTHVKKQITARILADLMKKFGDKVLAQIIPIVEKELDSEVSGEREGVCIVLGEIIASSRYDVIKSLITNIIGATLRKLLCDHIDEVRQAAAQAFDKLLKKVSNGNGVLDEILPFLIEKLSDPLEGNYALDSMKKIISVDGKDVVPYLIPILVAYPVHTEAMALLASVVSLADENLTKLQKLFEKFVTTLSESFDTSTEEQVRSQIQAVVLSLSVNNEQGIQGVIDKLVKLTKSSELNTKRSAVTILSMFCAHSKASILLPVEKLLPALILLMGDNDDDILELTVDSLAALVKVLRSDEKLHSVASVQGAIQIVAGELIGKATTLPGLNIFEGASSLWPIYEEALLIGNEDLKEQATLAMGELVSLSCSETIIPIASKVTGLLIRVFGERYGTGVKVAILKTVTLLLNKVGIHLRRFLSQLDAILWKCATDPDRKVRLNAVPSLAGLVLIHDKPLKPDFLFQDIIDAIITTEDTSVRDTLIFTLRAVIVAGGNKMTQNTTKLATNVLFQLFHSVEESTRISSAGCVGAMLQWIPFEEVGYILNPLFCEEEGEVALRHAKTTAFVVGLKECIDFVYEDGRQHKVHMFIFEMLSSDKVPVISNGIRACGYLFKHCLSKNITLPFLLVKKFANTINNQRVEVKCLLGMVSEVLGRSLHPQKISREFLKYLIPALVSGIKEENPMVQVLSQAALISVLQLRDCDSSTIKNCLNFMECDAEDHLLERLRTMANSPEGTMPIVDDTLLI